MKSSTRRALIISLCLHFIALIATFYIVVRQQFGDKFVDLLVVDVFSAPKVRELPPKVRIEPVKAVLREQMSKSVQPLFPKPDSVQPAALPFRQTQAVDINQPRHRLDTAQTDPEVKTDLSTAVRDLRTDQTALPQTEADTPTGTGTHGLKMFGTPGVQRTYDHSILEALEEEVGGDTVMPNLTPPGTGRGSPQINFDEVMKNLAEEIAKSSEGGPIDVVFVVDASGSMGDNIHAVANHLIDMIDVYKSAKIDYALGLAEFWAPGRPPRNIIKVLQLTKNMSDYKQELQTLQPRGDEHALDAINQTVQEMRFRPTSKKHMILVTDEPLTSLKGITLDYVIAQCREFDIHVNVLGINNDEHHTLAEETGGSWHAIPQDASAPPRRARMVAARRSRYNARALRNAQWTGAAEIGKVSLENLSSNALDVILFIDASQSMEDKLPKFLQQLEGMIRNWDDALIDYRIGVVRFRAGTGNFNYINVFQPPQTLDEIRKIIALPCQGSEQLLDAIAEGLRKIQLRPEAQPYLIIVTDEPSTGKYSPAAIIQLCLETGAKVSVIGTFDPFQQEVAMKTNGVWVPIPGGQTTDNTNW